MSGQSSSGPSSGDRTWWPIYCVGPDCLRTVRAYQAHEGPICEHCRRVYPWITAARPLPPLRG